MYALPIPYADYWRSAKSWSAYLGGTVILVAGTSAASLQISAASLQVPWKIPSQVSPGLTEISENEGIRNITFQIEDVEIPYGTKYVEAQDIPPGIQKVQGEGQQGLRRQVIKVMEIDGSIEKQIVYQFVLNAPKIKVIEQNTSPLTGEKFDISKLSIASVFMVEATAYTYTGNPTATGVSPRIGLIAVDPRVIPLGTKLYVAGYGYAVAADTGGDIKGHRIDVFFPTLGECLNWGRRPVQVYILNGK